VSKHSDRRAAVAVILASTVGVVLILGLILLFLAWNDGGDTSGASTIVIEILVILSLITGGLLAWINHDSHEHPDRPDDAVDTKPEVDWHHDDDEDPGIRGHNP
jgi:hypothetical protein